MGNSRNDDIICFNIAGGEGLISAERYEQFTIAKATFGVDTVDRLIEEEREVLDTIQKRRDENNKKDAQGAEHTEKETKSETPPNPLVVKTKKVYGQVTGMLRYKEMREEVLLNQEHRCMCCETQFPKRSEHELSDSGEPYPLIVRCDFPVYTYIQLKGQFDPKILARDEKLFNPMNYTALCTDCKPTSFSKKKKHD